MHTLTAYINRVKIFAHSQMPQPYLNASPTSSTSDFSDSPTILRDRTPIRITSRSRQMASLRVEIEYLNSFLEKQEQAIQKLKEERQALLQNVDSLENRKCILDFENTCLRASYLMLQSNLRELKDQIGYDINDDESVTLTSDEEER